MLHRSKDPTIRADAVGVIAAMSPSVKNRVLKLNPLTVGCDILAAIVFIDTYVPQLKIAYRR